MCIQAYKDDTKDHMRRSGCKPPELYTTYTVKSSEEFDDGTYYEFVEMPPNKGIVNYFDAKFFGDPDNQELVEVALDSQIMEALKAPHPDAKKFMNHTNDASGYIKGATKRKKQEDDEHCDCPACRSERGDKLNTDDLMLLRLQYMKIKTIIKSTKILDDPGQMEMLFEEKMRLETILKKHGIRL